MCAINIEWTTKGKRKDGCSISDIMNISCDKLSESCIRGLSPLQKETDSYFWWVNHNFIFQLKHFWHFICSGHSSLSQRYSNLRTSPSSWRMCLLNKCCTQDTIPRSMLCLPFQVLNFSGYICLGFHVLKGVREKEYERYNRREEGVRLEICTLAPSAPTSLLPFIHFKTFPIQYIYMFCRCDIPQG